ncbi:CubicO group peptidase (beta-lactamase class C family) [Sphingomonas kaistensis]|uniref:CubicO group peptidase (Beta-lactamase class C family) n=1 Tax=Sphingomonas kaistensis TaxID=298708 RepID=A0A7X6BF12_9SPHN|nr:serine hydrolase domain-containing protein [Sphingomonas kaistensis]NJC04298.1 CubicO group peptidase (beta-lactamase class C family) [Sphingomonas kaistensis]
MRIPVSILLASVASAASAAPANLQGNATAILRQDVPADGPGVSAVISENGRIVWSGAAGRADLASKAPIGPGSVFRYASITKQFTAALTLKLVEEGRLSLDDTLGKLLPAETPAAWHPVTVRQLLDHTSGIPSYTGKPGWMLEANTSRAFTTQGLSDITRDMPMEFAPGTSWNYNNTGYVLLSAIAEKLTGKPWYVALREKVTGPLGLASIRCGCEPGPAVVAGYTQGGKPSQRIDMTVPSGAGALVGTAGDLARWGAALHGGKVLKPATYQAMITPTGAGASAPLKYGFGLVRGEVRGLPTIGHNGGIFGFNTESLYAPDRKLFVAVLSNSDAREPGADTTARRLLASAAGVAYPVMTAQALDPKAVEPFLGIYKFPEAERRLMLRDGKLFTQRSGGEALEVSPAGNGRYFYGPSSLSYFDLARGADGKAVMRFYPNGALKADQGVWTSAAPVEAAAVALSPADRAAMAGIYEMGPVTMTIADTGTGLTGQLTGQQPIALSATGRRELRTVGIDARMVFEEADGKVVRVVLHQNGRTIPFERKP